MTPNHKKVNFFMTGPEWRCSPWESKKVDKVFDWMLYINLPIVYLLMLYGFNKVATTDYTTVEMIGLCLSGGILLATNGINVAHELCHRKNYRERFIGKALFLPCLYMHF